MINTCLIQQYANTPMAYIYKEKTQNEILISNIIQEPFWRLNIPVLEGSITKDQSQMSEIENQDEQSSASEKSSEQAHPREDETKEDCESSMQDQTEEQSEQDQSKQEQEDDYHIAHPFTHSGAVILTKQEMNLKFEQLPEDAALWIEEDGKKRKIELTQDELSISFNTDLVKATLVDAQGNVLRKWSILCLAQEDGSLNDLILEDKEEQQDSQSSSLQEQSELDSSLEQQDTSQSGVNMDSSTANESDDPLEEPLENPQQSPPEQSNPFPEEGSNDTQIQQEAPIESPPSLSQRPIQAPPKQDVVIDIPINSNNSLTHSNDEVLTVKPEECEIKLSVDQKTFTAGQKVFTQNLADVQIVVSKGTLLSTEIISHDTKQTYSSFQDAAKAEQSGTFDIKATILNDNLQQQAYWTLIQVGNAIATSTTKQGKKVDVVYQMDEQGKFTAQSKSQNQKIQLYRKFEPLNNKEIQSGENLRLYLDKEPGNYQVQINGQKTDVDMEKDELGQAYLPIETKTGTNTIQLLKDGQEVFSQEIFTKATSHLNTILIAGASLCVAFMIALFVYKRKGEVCG